VVGGGYMHRIVWAHHNGPIPRGWQVHHVDHDPANNAIENLALHDGGEHAVYHYHEGGHLKPYASKEWLDQIRYLAADARRTPEGRAKMSAAAKRGWELAEYETRVCTYCGKDYRGRVNADRRGFCGMSCQGMARKASGVDDIDRTCICCGAAFRSNKYTGGKSCSRSCAGKISAAKRLGRHASL
jgi:hypothetical protein